MPTPSKGYYIEGKRVKGVTTIIGENNGRPKTPLCIWANQWGLKGVAYKDINTVALDTGTLGHYLCICHLTGERPDKKYIENFSEEAQELANQCYRSFLEWLKFNKIKIFVAEQEMLSKEYQFGGTPDMIAKLKNGYGLIDLKTGNAVYEDMIIQLAGYHLLIQENYPDIKIEHFHLLRIGKESASFHHHYWRQLPPEAYEVFLDYVGITKRWKAITAAL